MAFKSRPDLRYVLWERKPQPDPWDVWERMPEPLPWDAHWELKPQPDPWDLRWELKPDPILWKRKENAMPKYVLKDLERDIYYKDSWEGFSSVAEILQHYLDPVKMERPDQLIRGYLELLARQNARRTMEQDGATVQGRAFIRDEERPAVGNAALVAEVLEPIQLLQQRLDRLEQSLARNGMLGA